MHVAGRRQILGDSSVLSQLLSCPCTTSLLPRPRRDSPEYKTMLRVRAVVNSRLWAAAVQAP
jgi:hypothetical protein